MINELALRGMETQYQVGMEDVELYGTKYKTSKLETIVNEF